MAEMSHWRKRGRWNQIDSFICSIICVPECISAPVIRWLNSESTRFTVNILENQMTKAALNKKQRKAVFKTLQIPLCNMSLSISLNKQPPQGCECLVWNNSWLLCDCICTHRGLATMAATPNDAIWINISKTNKVVNYQPLIVLTFSSGIHKQ